MREVIQDLHTTTSQAVICSSPSTNGNLQKLEVQKDGKRQVLSHTLCNITCDQEISIGDITGLVICFYRNKYVQMGCDVSLKLNHYINITIS